MRGYLAKGKKMKNGIMFGVVALLLAGVFGGGIRGEQIDNWRGWADTSSSVTCSSTVSVTGTAFQYTQDDEIRIVVQADDTSSAGFASDSVDIEWGYQTGSVVLNSSDAQDTLWSPKIVCDTMPFDSIGKMEQGVLSGATETRKTLWVDTSSVSGYMCQAATFVPSWDILIRPWAKGLASNNKGEPIVLRFTVLRRKYSPMRRR